MARYNQTQRGYTLLEVLIALLVFSIGLLGLAAMLVSAVKGNHQAYHRSQAVFIAEAMSDGLRANLMAVNGGNYNTGGLIDAHPGTDCATACSAVQMANRDLRAWAALADSRLPNGRIGVECVQQAASVVGDSVNFNGICTLRVAWSEVGDVGQSQDSSAQTFTWMMQP